MPCRSKQPSLEQKELQSKISSALVKVAAAAQLLADCNTTALARVSSSPVSLIAPGVCHPDSALGSSPGRSRPSGHTRAASGAHGVTQQHALATGSSPHLAGDWPPGRRAHMAPTTAATSTQHGRPHMKHIQCTNAVLQHAHMKLDPDASAGYPPQTSTIPYHTIPHIWDPHAAGAWWAWCSSGARPAHVSPHPDTVSAAHVPQGDAHWPDKSSTDLVAPGTGSSRRPTHRARARTEAITTTAARNPAVQSSTRSPYLVPTGSGLSDARRHVHYATTAPKAWDPWVQPLADARVHVHPAKRVAQKDTARVFLPFESALVLARSLNLKSYRDWKRWLRSGKRPPTIPSGPDRYYKNDGWQGWGKCTSELSPAGIPVEYCVRHVWASLWVLSPLFRMRGHGCEQNT